MCGSCLQASELVLRRKAERRCSRSWRSEDKALAQVAALRCDDPGTVSRTLERFRCQLGSLGKWLDHIPLSKGSERFFLAHFEVARC